MTERTSKNLSLALFGFFLLLVATVVAASAYKYMGLRDYPITFYAPCDPTEQACFVAEFECDSEDGVCHDYYTIIETAATAVSACAPDDGECLNAICVDVPEMCVETICTTESREIFGIDYECSP